MTLDVLVIGGGSAGLSAAIAARRRGASVRLVEQAPRDFRGGNTRHSRNFRLIHAVPTPYMPDSYSEEEFLAELARVTEGDSDAELARLVVRGTAGAAQWFAQNGVPLQRTGDGVLPYSRRTTFFLGGGRAAVNALYVTAQKLGIGIAYESEAVSLRLAPGGLCEADVVSGGRRERIAAKAVVACAGGHQSDREALREAFGPAGDGIMVRGTPYATGRMLRRLVEAGARPVGDPARCHMVAVDARGPWEDGGIVTRITGIPYGIVVDREARRFHDEGADTKRTHYSRWGPRVAAQAGQVAWLILDAAGLARAAPTALPPVAAPDIPSLGLKLGLDPEKLAGTVAAFNAAVREGRTEGLEPPKSSGAAPIAVPPFAGYPMRPGITFTQSGVAVDTRMRVLDEDGRPMEGVFAAGMIMAANVLGRGYLAGLAVSLCAVTGRIAGEEAARHAAR